MRPALIALLLLASAALAGPVAAQEPGPLIQKPQWVQRPTGSDVNAVYPVKAAIEGIGGRAVLACQVSPDGGLTGCSVDDQAPGHGFDKAALKLAAKFRMAPQAQPGSVRIPLVFKPMVEAVPLYPNQVRDASGEVLGSIDWVGKPSGHDVNRYFPAEAMARNASGRVVLDCKVKADGYVAPCTVVFESPPGLHFGDAALKLSTSFRLKAVQTGERSVVGGVVRIPLSFLSSEPSD